MKIRSHFYLLGKRISIAKRMRSIRFIILQRFDFSFLFFFAEMEWEGRWCWCEDWQPVQSRLKQIMSMVGPRERVIKVEYVLLSAILWTMNPKRYSFNAFCNHKLRDKHAFLHSCKDVHSTHDPLLIFVLKTGSKLSKNPLFDN